MPRGHPRGVTFWGGSWSKAPRTRREDPLDEAELLGAARSGDRQAFDELVRRTFVDTFTLARRLTGNEEDARDVVRSRTCGPGKASGRSAVRRAFRQCSTRSPRTPPRPTCIARALHAPSR